MKTLLQLGITDVQQDHIMADLLLSKATAEVLQIIILRNSQLS